MYLNLFWRAQVCMRFSHIHMTAGTYEIFEILYIFQSTNKWKKFRNYSLKSTIIEFGLSEDNVESINGQRIMINYLAYCPFFTSQRSIFWVPVTRSLSIITIICWNIHPLLGSDRATSNETTIIARQRLRKYAAVPEPSLGNISTQK
jgi:hypothetical protein